MTTYKRGQGGITLSAQQTTDLENARDNLRQQLITQPFQLGLGAPIYELLLQDISEAIPQGDGSVVLVPLPGVDQAVWNWINGAVSINEATGPASSFIRNYTIDPIYSARHNRQCESPRPGYRGLKPDRAESR